MKPFQEDPTHSHIPILLENKKNNPLFKATIFLNEIYHICRQKIETKPPNKILTLPSQKNPKYPHLNINAESNYIFWTGDEIINQKKNIIYKVQGLLGKGTFGQVLSCQNSNGHKMAIKIIKNKPAYINQGLLEIKFLRQIAKYEKSIGGSRENYLNVFDAFKWNEHVCTVMEIMDNSLFDILRSNNYQRIQMKWIKLWTQKILLSLVKVHKIGIIHCDIKPQNIMFRPQKPQNPLLIDFSSGSYVNQQIFTYIQSRFYRAPQVLIRMSPYSAKIDIWSLGCLLSELYLGLPLFPGSSGYDQLKKIIQIQRVPTINMIEKSNMGKRYFNVCKETEQVSIKSEEQYFKDTGEFVMENESYFLFQSFEEMTLHANPEQKDLPTHQLFVDLIKRMLVVDPQERISAEKAYIHPFIGGRVKDFENGCQLDGDEEKLDSSVKMEGEKS